MQYQEFVVDIVESEVTSEQLCCCDQLEHFVMFVSDPHVPMLLWLKFMPQIRLQNIYQSGTDCK